MKNLRINQRDLAILSDIAEAGGLLDSATIHDRHFGLDRTGEACSRRLRKFREQGLLSVVKPTITFGPESSGRLPTVYGLTSSGATLLHEATGVSAKPISLTAQNLQHRLEIAKVRLLVNDACQIEKFSPALWIGEYDHRDTPITPAMKLSARYKLCHQYQNIDKKSTCWPDLACLITLVHPKGESRLQILWEIDRSTERLAQIEAKMEGYKEFFQRGDEKHPFGTEATTRVFFVTPSIERCQSIAQAIRDKAGTERVRLAHTKALTAETFFRQAIWMTTDGAYRKILAE